MEGSAYPMRDYPVEHITKTEVRLVFTTYLCIPLLAVVLIAMVTF